MRDHSDQRDCAPIIDSTANPSWPAPLANIKRRRFVPSVTSLLSSIDETEEAAS